MSTTINFYNRNNNLITEQQANQLNDFLKEIHIDNILKKKETYYDKTLWGGTYYLSPGENVTEVLTNLGAHLKWSIASNKQVINGYTVFDYRFYDDNLQQESKYSKEVTDNLGNHIATVSFDSVTNQAISAYKVFNYGNQQIPWEDSGDLFPEDSWISFSISYKDNEKIVAVTMMYDIINNDSLWTDLNSFLTDAEDMLEEIGLTQEKLDYFTNIEPVVPNF